MPAKAHAITDVPHPVATKIYYSLRNQRLRSALNHLYFGASSMDSSSDCVSSKALQKTELPSQKLCPTNFHKGLPDIQLEKRWEERLETSIPVGENSVICTALLLKHVATGSRMKLVPAAAKWKFSFSFTSF
nr:SCA7 domain-containing protein [Ipomoea batatas]GME05177.1 SCA7 domain-containing protein [Ipomoea batatas]